MPLHAFIPWYRPLSKIGHNDALAVDSELDIIVNDIQVSLLQKESTQNHTDICLTPPQESHKGDSPEDVVEELYITPTFSKKSKWLAVFGTALYVIMMYIAYTVFYFV